MVRIWFENADGTLYSGCCQFGVGGNYAVGGGKSRRGKEKVLPAKFVVAHMIAGEVVKLPFELKNIPVR